MGWMAYYPDGTVLSEDKDGRPVQDGNDGKLSCIVQEDFGHKVAIDLINGIIFIDYDSLDFQNGSFSVANPKTMLFVCEDTNIVGDLYDIIASEPNDEGWYTNTIVPISWRPIWFTRHTNESRTKVIGLQATIPSESKVIGLQATLPESFGGKNVKKLVCLFEDGRIGIY